MRAAPLTCVILAAGTASRFGRDKLLAPIGNTTLIQRALAACGGFETVIVASPQIARHLSDRDESWQILVNEEPELGMSHSLQLANANIAKERAIAVVPADLALIEPQHVRSIAELADGYDVTFPVSPEGVPGHPVIFSAEARARIAALTAGDTIRNLRDDSALERNPVVIAERWPFTDIDRESDLANL